jgi:hypothetical protein
MKSSEIRKKYLERLENLPLGRYRSGNNNNY